MPLTWLRVLREPHTLTIIACLGIGIAGLTGVYSVLSRILEVYGLAGERRVVRVMADHKRFGFRTSPSTSALLEWMRELRSFERLAGFAITDAGIRSDEGALSCRMVLVSEGFLDLLEAEPTAGRTFEHGEHRNVAPVVMISESLSRIRFGGDALGESLIVDGRPLTVVGVFPDELEDSISPGEQIDALRPIEYSQHKSVQVLGRLQRGVSLPHAQAELNAWASNRGDPDSEADASSWVLLRSSSLIDSQTLYLLKASIVGGVLLLLVTGTNVAHLVTAQMGSQRRAVSTRWALGANRWHLFVHLGKQALLVTILACGVASVLTAAGLAILTRTVPAHWSFLKKINLDSGAILVSVLAPALILLVCGIFPSLWRSGGVFVRDLRAGGTLGKRSPLGRTFGHLHIVTLVGSAFLLTVGASIVIATIFKFGRSDLGFQVDNLHVVTIELPAWKYRDNVSRAAYVEELQKQVSALPEVVAVVASTHEPSSSGVFLGETKFDTGSDQARISGAVGLASVGRDYFQTVRQRILSGRTFTSEDFETSVPRVVISESTSRLFGHEPDAAIGGSIWFGSDRREVIGVVADVRTPGLAQSLAKLQVYWPLVRHRKTMRLVVRVERETDKILHKTVRGMDPDVILEETTMKSLIAESLSEVQLLRVGFSLMAVIAILLAIFGVYGVLSSFTAQQRGQIALRMAMGARRWEVIRWVVLKGLSRSLAGIAIGLVASFPLSWLLRAQLLGVEPDNMEARVVGTLLLLTVTGFASWLPAVRASRVAPSEILKEV